MVLGALWTKVRKSSSGDRIALLSITGRSTSFIGQMRSGWRWKSVIDRKTEQFAMFVKYRELVRLEGFMEPYMPHLGVMQFAMSQDVLGHVQRVNGTAESAWATTRGLLGAKRFIYLLASCRVMSLFVMHLGGID